MLTRSLEIRIARLEQAATAHTKYDPACICFPANQFPKVAWPMELEIAAKVKCPLHGDRFAVPSSFRFNYVSKWLREKTWGLWVPRCSEQYQKAYYASFPSDLWPAEEEETEHGIYLRLKDGTRLLAAAVVAENSRDLANTVPFGKPEHLGGGDRQRNIESSNIEWQIDVQPQRRQREREN